MKIAIFSYKKDLLDNHEVKYFNCLQDTTRVVEDIIKFKPDIIIEQEYNDGKAIYSDLYKKIDKVIKVPKVYWLIDAHCNLIEHIAYAKQFDFIMCAQSWFIPLLQNQVRAQLYYLPLCHTQTIKEYEQFLTKPKQASMERTIELSFVGNIRSIHVERRKRVMDLMESMGDSFLATTSDYDSMLDILSRSKLTFNCSLNEDLNFRVWEALATNTPLITDYVADINMIKDLWQHIRMIYPRSTELRLGEPLTNPIIDTIDFIRKSHTYTHRYNQLLWMVMTKQQVTF